MSRAVERSVFGLPRWRHRAAKTVIARAGFQRLPKRSCGFCSNAKFNGRSVDAVGFFREGTGVEPGWLAKPGKHSGPIVNPTEGRNSDFDRGRGRRHAVLPGGDSRCRLVDAVAGKPGQCSGPGPVPLAEQKPEPCRPVGNHNAGSEPSGEGQASR